MTKVNLPNSEVNGSKTLLIQQFERKILTSMEEILSLSHQKNVGLVLVLLSLLQSKCFIQSITKVSKTTGAANNLAEAPEIGIPVETKDSRVVIYYPNVELKYVLIFKLSIGIKLQ